MKGFFRLAAAVPVLKVGDPSFNADRIIEAYSEAVAAGASIVAFPELSITGYSCGDMFDQTVLIDASMNAQTRVPQPPETVPRGEVGYPSALNPVSSMPQPW